MTSPNDAKIYEDSDGKTSSQTAASIQTLESKIGQIKTAQHSEQLGQMAATIETLESKIGQIKNSSEFRTAWSDGCQYRDPRIQDGPNQDTSIFFYNIFLYIFDFFIIFHIFLHFLHMFPGIQPQAKEMIDLRNIVPNPRPCTKKKHRNLHGHIGDQKVNQFGAGRLGNSILTLILMIILVDISCFQPLQRAARIWRKQEFENST